MEISPLPEAEIQNLRQVCAELGMPSDALDYLLFVVQCIRMHETGPRRKSAPQRKRELDHVACLAKRLNDALQHLDSEDRGAIHKGFDGGQVKILLDPPDPLRAVFTKSMILGESPLRAGRPISELMCENVLLLGDALLTLGTVAKQANESVSGSMRGGAPSELVRRSAYIVSLAELANAHGLEIGRGKGFVLLCEAAFLAAGIEVGPEPAIRKFMADLLPAYREMWAQRNDPQGVQDDNSG